MNLILYVFQLIDFNYLYVYFFQLFRILSDMRTLSADWMANNSRPEAEQQSMHHVGEESRGNIFYPRAVAPTAAQVSLYPCVLDYNKNQWFFFPFLLESKVFQSFPSIVHLFLCTLISFSYSFFSPITGWIKSMPKASLFVHSNI